MLVLRIVLIAEQGPEDRDLAEPGDARFIVHLSSPRSVLRSRWSGLHDGEGGLCRLLRKDRDIVEAPEFGRAHIAVLDRDIHGDQAPVADPGGDRDDDSDVLVLDRPFDDAWWLFVIPVSYRYW